MPFFVTFETGSCIPFPLLCSAFLCHMSIFVAVEALQLPVFKVVVGLSNIHWLSPSSICCSCGCLVILSSFYGLISLSYRYNCHFPLLECLGHCYGWITQYRLDYIVSYILLQQKDGVELICVCLHGQRFEFYHEVRCVSFALLEHFYLPFSICCLGLVTERCLEFFYKLVPILGIVVFVKLIELLLYIYSYYTSSEAS